MKVIACYSKPKDLTRLLGIECYVTTFSGSAITAGFNVFGARGIEAVFVLGIFSRMIESCALMELTSSNVAL